MRISSTDSPSVRDLQWLRKQVKSVVAPKRLVERCRIVLLGLEGRNHEEIARALGITRQKAARWRKRFAEGGRAGLEFDAPGRGRKPVYGPEITPPPTTPTGPTTPKVGGPVALILIALEVWNRQDELERAYSDFFDWICKDPPTGGPGKRAYETDKEFRRWFHREWKPDRKKHGPQRYSPDIDEDEMDEAYEDWIQEGKPRTK